MSLNSAVAKLRSLAAADATMQGIFGVAPFRTFFVREDPGYIQQGTCCRLNQVSAVYIYAQEGITQIEQVRLQVDVLDLSQETARNAFNAVSLFIADRVDLMTNSQFVSPPGPAVCRANYRLSQRSTIEVQIKQTVYVWSADWRIFNNLNVP